MTKFLRACLSLLSIAAVACSDSNDPINGNPLIDGTLTANVTTGISFTGDTRVTATLVSGVLVITAIQTAGTTIRSIDIDLNNVTATGTFNIGTGNPGNIATYSEIVNSQASSWIASVAGGTGQVVIAHLTSTHIGGTFSFTADALSGTATGTKTVTSGTFSIQLSAPE